MRQSANASSLVEGKEFTQAIIIGAGFGGLRALNELRRINVDARIIEAGSDVGGTWYWNRYPGARTDTESWAYTFFFSEELNSEYEFKERFATQSHALEYLQYAANKLNMRKDIEFNTRVISAKFDENDLLWTIKTDTGKTYSCKYLVSASGLLSVPYIPKFEGSETFSGKSFLSSRWPKEDIDLEGKRVAIIGSGATAVQIFPEIACVAKEVIMFQRTPNYVIPARNYPITEFRQREIREKFNEMIDLCHQQVFAFPMVDSKKSYMESSDEERKFIFEGGWEEGGFRFLFETFNDLLINDEANEAAAEFIRQKIRSVVKDKALAEKLCPDYPLLAKRPPLGHFYYETFNRENVKLVDLKSEPISKLVDNGIETSENFFEVDVIIYATGFDAATGALTAMDIQGRNGISISEKWKDGAAAYLGICTDDFPNFFMISGPQGPFANIPMVIDRAVNWIGSCINKMEMEEASMIEADGASVKEWSDYMSTLLNATVLRKGYTLNSWFLGANIPGKTPSVLYYFGGANNYFKELDENIRQGFKGVNYYFN